MSKFRNFENYEVFEDGRIFSYKSKKFLKPSTLKNGYQIVCLSDNECKRKLYLLHRVVHETFSGEPIPLGMQVNHIDERKYNNARSNLNLMSPKENTNWGSGIERCRKARINGKRSKQVGAFDKNGELVFTFPSVMEAHRNDFDGSSITKCCNGKLKTHKGFTWKYI